MALPESNPKEGAPKKTTNQDDKDFDPTPEALIDEIDDERTLEEEEALDGVTPAAVQEELDDLKKESEMPIEELLAYYERMRNEAHYLNSDRDEEDEEVEGEDEEEDEDEEEEEEEDPNNDKSQSCSIRSGKKRKKDDEDDEEGGDALEKRHTSTKYPTESLGNKSIADSTSLQQEPTSDASNSKQNQGSECETANSNLAGKLNCTTTKSVTDNTVDSSAKQTSNADSTHDAQNNRLETTSGHEDEEEGEDRLQRPKQSMTNFIIDDENDGMFDSLFGYDLDDSDDDYSYTDGENDDERNWRRVIHIGSEFQADIPDELSEYDYLPPYENEDKLVWKWNDFLTHEKLLDYLKQASALSKKKEVSVSPSSVPKISYDKMRLYSEKILDLASNAMSIENNQAQTTFDAVGDVYISQSRKRALIDYKLEQENALNCGNQVAITENTQVLSSREDNSDTTSQDVARLELSTEEYFQDEEQLLYLLLQCNHNIEEAFRRRKLDPSKHYMYEPMSLWSEDECLGFEHGLKLYGKNFRSIRENKVPTRTYAEVVAFYYLWKKSERHDVYTNQYKLDRKRCLSHPGTTDYMDKFIEDNESNLNATSSTCTPTPTESTIGLQSNLKVVREINLPLTSCRSTDVQSASDQHINLSLESTTQRYHLQLHHPQKAESCLGDK